MKGSGDRWKYLILRVNDVESSLFFLVKIIIFYMSKLNIIFKKMQKGLLMQLKGYFLTVTFSSSSSQDLQ